MPLVRGLVKRDSLLPKPSLMKKVMNGEERHRQERSDVLRRSVTGGEHQITAILELLKMLNLQGAVVTIDAMGTQREIASQIVDLPKPTTLSVSKGTKVICTKKSSSEFDFAARQLDLIGKLEFPH